MSSILLKQVITHDSRTNVKVKLNYFWPVIIVYCCVLEACRKKINQSILKLKGHRFELLWKHDRFTKWPYLSYDISPLSKRPSGRSGSSISCCVVCLIFWKPQKWETFQQYETRLLPWEPVEPSTLIEMPSLPFNILSSQGKTEMVRVDISFRYTKEYYLLLMWVCYASELSTCTILFQVQRIQCVVYSYTNIPGCWEW